MAKGTDSPSARTASRSSRGPRKSPSATTSRRQPAESSQAALDQSSDQLPSARRRSSVEGEGTVTPNSDAPATGPRGSIVSFSPPAAQNNLSSSARPAVFPDTGQEHVTRDAAPDFDPFMNFTPTNFENIHYMSDILHVPTSQLFEPGLGESLQPVTLMEQYSPIPFDNTAGLLNLSPGLEAKSGRVSGLEYGVGSNLDSDDREHLSAPGLSVWKDLSNGKFIGAVSTGNIVSSSLRGPIQLNGTLTESDARDYLIGAVEHVDEAGAVDHDSVFTPALPSDEATRRFAKAYYRHVHPVYPIVVQQTLETEWASVRDQHATATSLSLVYLITAIGCLNDHSGVSSEVERITQSQAFHRQSWELLGYVLDRPYMRSVQVIILHVIYLSHLSKSGISWVLCGLAIRIAQSLGLHRRHTGDPSLTEAEQRVRSAVWWVCYTLDALLSASQGRLPAIPDELCETSIDLEALTSPGLSNVLIPRTFRWHVELSRIKNKLSCLFAGVVAKDMLAGCIGELDMALTTWRDNLPLEVRPEQEIVAAREHYPFIAMLHLQYFNTLCVLHWISADLARRDRLPLDSRLHPRVSASESVSVSAARSFIKVLNDLSEEFSEEKIPPVYTHTDHYMTAISIIFANIFKYPQKMSARADLEFLKACHYHFTQQVNPYRFNPRMRNLFHKIMSSAESLLQSQNSKY
ncbi:fungal-specific transcription factor domain-containing protein [Exophiala viscosa]|uniref:fungal-specific transcription factor domain-containing protein n=1 Tax=Exophiala viscosa TaxID=2486360 RepID=UPI00218F87DC|nr:fungal-specific transcription factor domain-containing protein [Exophiala viscosa]